MPEATPPPTPPSERPGSLFRVSTASPHSGRDLVAITLAIGIATAINAITVAVLYDAIVSSTSGLSENATQVLTTAFGGIIGVLGGYLGFKAGEDHGVARASLAIAEDAVTRAEVNAPPNGG